ncbi:MAG: PEP-CTERM system histidine kinase PrsK [Alphaproteobacteria bacterium]|nr:PEP-CTERM system histidine kinase PrsK [Alphaproteobacteria bacterium]
MAGDLALVLVSHALSVISFAALFVLVAIGRRPSPHRVPLLLAAAGTTAWAGATMLAAPFLNEPIINPFIEWTRIAGWVWLTIGLLSAAAPERATSYRRMAVAGLGLPLMVMGASSGAAALGFDVFTAHGTSPLEVGALIALVVFGFGLLETLVRWTSPRGRTAAMHFFIGIGALLAIDLFLYATTLLLGRVDAAIYEARGVISAFAPPLVALALARQRDWFIDIHVSRQIVVNAATLAGAGGYLLAMALAGFAVRELNAVWGPMLHITFLAGAAVVLVSVLASDGLRPRLNNWVSRNFFSAKYDYRREWLRFSEALAVDAHQAAVEERLLEAILAGVSCRTGGLWLRLEDEDAFAVAAARPSSFLLSEAPVPRLAAEMLAADTPQILKPGSACWTELGQLGAFARPWIAVPLRHRGRLIGFLVLADHVTSRSPEAEDCEFLQALGVQAAGHLAEERSAIALNRTRRFESTARQLTYIGHDLKNIVSQLSLVMQNWSRHRENQAFIDDLPRVLDSSVSRMKGLLEGIKAGPSLVPNADGLVNVRDCVDALLPLWRARYRRLVVDFKVEAAFVRGRVELIQSIFDQLVSNAIDASDGARDVTLRMALDGAQLRCEIADHGGGISERSVADSHFQTRQSAKPAGYGVGLFQVRDHVRGLGGTLSFESSPHTGTTARLTFPTEPPPARVALQAAARPTRAQLGAAE